MNLVPVDMEVQHRVAILIVVVLILESMKVDLLLTLGQEDMKALPPSMKALTQGL
jgi:hypothetical protein